MTFYYGVHALLYIHYGSGGGGHTRIDVRTIFEDSLDAAIWSNTLIISN